MPGLPRRNVHPLEPAQCPDGSTRQVREAQVYLRDFVSGNAAGVSDIHVHLQVGSRLQGGCRKLRVAVGDLRIAQSVPKRKGRFGSGLSYSKSAYSNAKLSASTL